MDLLKTGQDILTQMWYIPRAILIMLLISLSILFIQDNGKEALAKLWGFLKQKWKTAFLFYLSFLLVSTLLGRMKIYPYNQILAHLWFNDDPIWNAEIIENIILFIPYSFIFLKAFYPDHPFQKTLKLTIITSCSIEICQLLFWLGHFQVSDILYNTIGGIIGYGIWRIVRRNRFFLLSISNSGLFFPSRRMPKKEINEQKTRNESSSS